MKGLDRKLAVPAAVREIARRLEESGYETWAVGGAIRDALLNEFRSDWDLATAARPEAVRKLFRPSYPIGAQFGTVGVRGSDGRVYEVTTFRRDIETDGRHAVVEYADTLDEDLARRDFTINAIAYHPLRDEFHDPFDGWSDLQRLTLRCVGEPALRFAEDYLRVLRGLRFAGRYRLTIESPTWEALKAAVPTLSRLSAERVREELLKTLAAPAATPGLTLYRESGALNVVIPELAGATAWDETCRTVDALDARRLNLRLAALLAPAAGAVEPLMTRLRFSNAEIRDVVAFCRALDLTLPTAGDPVSARRWLRQVGRERARDALRLHLARARARQLDAEARRNLAARSREVLGAIHRGDPVALGDLAIDGNDLKVLGLSPGPEFARILGACLDEVIRDPRLNQREQLMAIVRRQTRC